MTGKRLVRHVRQAAMMKWTANLDHRSCSLWPGRCFVPVQVRVGSMQESSVSCADWPWLWSTSAKWLVSQGHERGGDQLHWGRGICEEFKRFCFVSTKTGAMKLKSFSGGGRCGTSKLTIWSWIPPVRSVKFKLHRGAYTLIVTSTEIMSHMMYVYTVLAPIRKALVV
jgi:hypothetical protein